MNRWTFFAILALAAGSAAPQPSAIDKGLAYVKSQQQSDGSWGTPDTAVTDTDAAVEALSLCFNNPALDAAFAFLKATSVEGTDQSSRLLFGLTFSKEILTPKRDALVALQGADGGWGAAKGHRSSPLDAALAMRALARPKALHASAMQAGTAYLLSTDLAGGGWPLQPEGPAPEDATGDVLTTAVAVAVVSQYQFSQGLETTEVFTVLNAATAFLLSKQNPNGSFGADQSVLETAWAMRAVVRMNPASAALATAKTFLEGAQLPDGSWAGDVHLTALAVLALREKGKPPVPGLADLTIVSGSLSATPATPDAGSSVLLQAVVKNQGGRKAFNVKVRFTLNGNPIGVPVFVPQIGPGETTTSTSSLVGETFSSVSTIVTLPSGDHTLGVTVDPDNAIPESLETNNSASKPVHVNVASLPDLSIASGQLSLSEPNPQAGEVFTLSFPLFNSGGTAVTGSWVRVFDGDPGSGGLQKGPDLPIDVEATSVQPFNVPITLSKGTHTLFVVADPAGLITESDESNNVATIGVDVVDVPLPDFYVTGSTITFTPAEAAAGEAVLVRALVRNATPVSPAKESLRPGVRVRFFRGDPGSGGTPFGGDFVVPFVDPGPGSIIEFTASFQSGAHPIFALVDPDVELTEVTRANNLAFAVLPVNSGDQADLVVDSVVLAPASPLDGQPVFVTVNVKNIGARAAENFRVRLAPGPGSAPLAQDAILALVSPGATSPAVFGWVATAGPHLLFATADPHNTVGELVETNNTGVASVSVSGTSFQPNVVASHKGKDFWLAWPTTSIVSAEIVVQSDVATTFSVTSTGFGASGNASPGNPGIVVLPSALMSTTPGSVVTNSKGIHVTSPLDVSVTFRTPAGTSQNQDGSYRALPTNALGTRYGVFMSDSASLSPPRSFLVVGTQNATTFSFTHPFFGTYGSTVNQGDVVHWPFGVNFNGAILTSDKPVAVFYDDLRPFLPNTAFGHEVYDPIVPQYAPTQLAGVLFHVVPWAFEKQADFVRILALHDDTQVTVTPSSGAPIVKNMPQSKWFDVYIPQGGSMKIQSSRPVAAYLAKTHGASPDFTGFPPPDGYKGDPEVVALIPTNKFTTSCRTYAPPGYAQGQFVTIIAPTAGTVVSIDGSVISSGFVPLVGAGQYVIVPVTPGEHLVTASKPVGVYAQGYHLDSFFSFVGLLVPYKQASSYAYYGGFTALDAGELTASLIKVNPDAVGTGVSTSVTAEVINSGYVAASNVRVRFTLGDPIGGVPLGPDQIIGTLGAGQSQTLSATFSTLAAGIHDVFVSVDPLNVVAENVESDNTLSTPLRVIAQGLVVATAETDQSGYFAQSPGKVTAELANIGVIDMKNLTVKATIETAGGTTVLDLGNQPVHLLEATPPALADWHYRTKISFTAPKGLHTQVLFTMPVNFTTLFASLAVAGSFDAASARVLEKTSLGLVERRCVFIGGASFNAATNASGRVEWVVDGPIASGASREFFLFFDTLENGPKVDVPRPAEYVGNGVSIYTGGVPSEWLDLLKSSRNGVFGPPTGFGFNHIFDLPSSLIAATGFGTLDLRDCTFVDLNRDAFLDFMSNLHGLYPVIGSPRYSLQRTNQTFEPSRSLWAAEAGNNPGSNMLVADWDGDGKADILSFGIISTLAGPATAFFWKGLGDGNFDVPKDIDPGFPPFGFDTAVGDLDNDGKADFVRVAFAVEVYKNLGGLNFAFAGSAYPPGGGGGTIAVGDFNGDGDEDVVHGNSSNQFTLFAGNGTGALASGANIPSLVFPDPAFLLNLVAYDFDRDAKQDLVLFAFANPGRVYLARGNGDGAFQPMTLLGTAGPNPADTFNILSDSGPLPKQVYLAAPAGATASPTTTLVFDFNTGDLLPGDYKARIDVLDAGTGLLLATATDDFVIFPTQDGGAAASIVADKTSYAPGETATLSSSVTNLGTNVTLTNLTATVTVPGISFVFTFAHPVASLGPQQTIAFNDLLNVTPSLPPGAYTASVVVTDSQGAELASDAYPFVILEVSQLVGTLQVAPFVVSGGAPVTATFSVTNTGNVAFSGTREILVVEPVDGSILATYSAALTLNPGQSAAGFQSIPTALPGGGYMVVLRAVTPATVTNLASAGFIVQAAACQFLNFAVFADVEAQLSGTSMTDQLTVAVPLSAPFGHVGSNGNVKLNGTPKVKGDVKAHGTITLAGNPTVTGTQTQGAPTIALPDVSAFITAAAGSNSNASIPLTSGGKSALVNGGLVVGDGDTLTLGAGTYYFKSVKLTGTAKLTLNGVVRFAVDGDVDLSGQSVANTGAQPSLFAALVQGGKKVKLGGGAKLHGLVYAPGADLTLDGASVVFGGIVGKNVTLKGGALVHRDPSIQSFCGFLGN